MRSNRFLICVCAVILGFFSLGFSQQSAEKLFQAWSSASAALRIANEQFSIPCR